MGEPISPAKIGDALLFRGGFGVVTHYLPNERCLVMLQAGGGIFMSLGLANVLTHEFKMTFPDEVGCDCECAPFVEAEEV